MKSKGVTLSRAHICLLGAQYLLLGFMRRYIVCSTKENLLLGARGSKHQFIAESKLVTKLFSFLPNLMVSIGIFLSKQIVFFTPLE